MAGRRGSRKPQPPRGPSIPPEKAREFLAGQVKEAKDLLAQGHVTEDAFEVWNSATTNVMKAAFGEDAHIVYEVRDAGALNYVRLPGEELPRDHYRRRLDKAIPRIEGAVKQLALGLAPPLDELAAAASAAMPAEMTAREPEWDVFICHASEDKEAFVRPLAEALQKRGLRVWYDEFTLKVGDSLREAIDRGLASSQFGVVILSPHFLAKKGWSQKELAGLMAREVDGRKVILPIWHNITAEQLRAYSPVLTDRVASRSEKGVEVVVEDLLRATGKQGSGLSVRSAPSGRDATAPSLASADEIESAIKWFDDPNPEVRRDAANQLFGLTCKKRIFHYEPVRSAIRRRMEDPDEEVRVTALRIHMALMRWERAAVGGYYAEPLIAVAETDASLAVRLSAMGVIGSTGDSHFCERVYSWIVHWPEEVYKQVDPISALIGLAHAGLKDRIRDGLRSLFEGAVDPAVRARLNDALRRMREIP